MALRDELIVASRLDTKEFIVVGSLDVQTMDYVTKQEEGTRFDRVVILTDEQDCDVKSQFLYILS